MTSLSKTRTKRSAIQQAKDQLLINRLMVSKQFFDELNSVTWDDLRSTPEAAPEYLLPWIALSYWNMSVPPITDFMIRDAIFVMGDV